MQYKKKKFSVSISTGISQDRWDNIFKKPMYCTWKKIGYRNGKDEWKTECGWSGCVTELDYCPNCCKKIKIKI